MYAEPLLRGVRDLIGDDVVAWATHYFCKLPGDGEGRFFSSRCFLLGPYSG